MPREGQEKKAPCLYRRKNYNKRSVLLEIENYYINVVLEDAFLEEAKLEKAGA